MDFVGFPKMARLSRDIIITEKIDGTNAQVAFIESSHVLDGASIARVFIEGAFYNTYVGSRTRWITPENDNFGFAAWVKQNLEELKLLGPGHHFGEWWGKGIQRGYGLDHRRFSLFNATRWATMPVGISCCHVVPILHCGPMDTARIEGVLGTLRMNGSHAAPGFMNPEGIVVWHTAGNVGFKKTIKDDEKPKGANHG